MTETLTITRRLSAPPALVFRALTEANLLARWMFPEGCSNEKVEADARPGGRFAFAIVKPDGARAPAEGRYLEVSPPARLSLAWTWTKGELAGIETVLSFDLAPAGGGTLLTLTHEGLPTEAWREDHRKGWTSILGSLETLVSAEASAA